MHFGRVAAKDTILRGVQIRADDIVTLWHASGNRDERVFHRPEVLDLAVHPTGTSRLGTGLITASVPTLPRWRSRSC
nr:hypothetical protein [Salinispora arenicola]